MSKWNCLNNKDHDKRNIKIRTEPFWADQTNWC